MLISIIYLLFVFAIIGATVWLLYGNYIKANDVDEVEVTARLNKKKYKLEVASTEAQRAKGLMYREKLGKNDGMLFVFPVTGFYPFWMKNTLIPLDMIWLNSDKKVVYIKENAQPCQNTFKALCESVVPTSVAKYIIELNAGEVSKAELKVGDEVEF